KATAEGRIGEFAEHGWDADVVPDPQDPETFTRSKLDWAELGKEPHAQLLDLHRALLARRRAPPELVDPDLRAIRTDFDDDQRWLVVHRGTLRVVANLSDRPREIQLDRPATRGGFATGDEPVGGAGAGRAGRRGGRRRVDPGLPGTARPGRPGELHRVARRVHHGGRPQQGP